MTCEQIENPLNIWQFLSQIHSPFFFGSLVTRWGWGVDELFTSLSLASLLHGPQWCVHLRPIFPPLTICSLMLTQSHLLFHILPLTLRTECRLAVLFPADGISNSAAWVELVLFMVIEFFVKETLLGFWQKTFFMYSFLANSLIQENHDDSLTTRLLYCWVKRHSPRPTTAFSSSELWTLVMDYRLSISLGSWLSFHSTSCLITWFKDSLLFVVKKWVGSLHPVWLLTLGRTHFTISSAL